MYYQGSSNWVDNLVKKLEIMGTKTRFNINKLKTDWILTFVP